MTDGASPACRPDLLARADVHDLVTTFYREIMFDELLEPIFGEVAEVDWIEHIPRLIDYWCSIIFGTTIYKGSVTKAHRRVHDLRPVEPEHCDRWFALWVHSVDERWEGPNAERVKSYAAALMAGMAKRGIRLLVVCGSELHHSQPVVTARRLTLSAAACARVPRISSQHPNE